MRLIFKKDKAIICEEMRESVSFLAINHTVNARIIIATAITNGDEYD